MVLILLFYYFIMIKFVSSEEFEGVVDGIYYKYVFDGVGGITATCSGLDGVLVGEKLDGSGVVWAKFSEAIDMLVSLLGREPDDFFCID